jgi:hypothetical protein
MTEGDIADLRDGNFQAGTSGTAQHLRAMSPHGDLTRRSLYSFASLIGSLAGVKLPRDFRQRKELLLKWFFQLDPN